MSLAALQKVAKKKSSSFPDNTVIRWKASDRYNYTAIKTGIGWATSARAGNQFVPQIVTFKELLEILGKDEVTEIAVAISWAEIDSDGKLTTSSPTLSA